MPHIVGTLHAVFLTCCRASCCPACRNQIGAKTLREKANRRIAINFVIFFIVLQRMSLAVEPRRKLQSSANCFPSRPYGVHAAAATPRLPPPGTDGSICAPGRKSPCAALAKPWYRSARICAVFDRRKEEAKAQGQKTENNDNELLVERRPHASQRKM